MNHLDSLPVSRTAVAGVVILYHPPVDFIDNLASYAAQVDRLYVVDNTEPHEAEETASRLQKFTNAEYSPQGANRGVAAGLNRGADAALANGYRYLLTMDQDSVAAPDMVEQLLSVYKVENGSAVGTACPVSWSASRLSGPKKDMEDVPFCMTSGSLLNLQAYREVGRFWEELFIDCVDDEYCLRLRLHGYRIVRFGGARIKHDPGFPLKAWMLGLRREYSGHSPERLYYMVRNNLVVRRQYAGRFSEIGGIALDRIVREGVKTLALQRRKWSCVKMMWRGYDDYRRGILGQLRDSPKVHSVGRNDFPLC
jgi:rhamnosyltransferase